MEENIQRLVTWAKENGASIDDRVKFNFSEEKGVHATLTDSVYENETLINIPETLVIGSQLSSEILPGFQYKNTESFSNNEMTLLVISRLSFDEKFASDRFQPYWDILPKRLNTAYYWSVPEKFLLEGTDCGVFLERNLRKVLEEWHSLISYALSDESMSDQKSRMKKDISFYEDYTRGKLAEEEIQDYLNKDNSSWTSFRNYFWSYNILTSRGFPSLLISQGGSNADLDTAILIPIFDLLNHKNKSKVKWANEKKSNGSGIVFEVQEVLSKDSELFNNYGDKTNDFLLLNYGFVQDNNEFEQTSLSLQIGDADLLKGAYDFGVRFYDGNEEAKDFSLLANGMNFTISESNPLPDNLVGFFSYLTQLKFEKDAGMTLRMKLDGLLELRRILESKMTIFKKNDSITKDVRSEIYKMVKIYRKGQKLLFQKSFDSLQVLEKTLLKKYRSEILSFKTILKNDIAFMDSLKTGLNISSYEEIVRSNLLNEITTLWIVRVSNKNNYDDSIWKDGAFTKHINYISSQFDDIVLKSVDLTEEDRIEWNETLEVHLPRLSKAASSIYNKGKWGIIDLATASSVMDRVCYLRPTNQEMFFIQKVNVEI